MVLRLASSDRPKMFGIFKKKKEEEVTPKLNHFSLEIIHIKKKMNIVIV